MKFAILDARENFIFDIETRMMIDDRDIEVVQVSSSCENISSIIDKHKDITLVVADNIIDERTDWNIPNCTVVGYSTSNARTNSFSKFNIPSFGYIRNSNQLLNMLEGSLPQLYKEPESQKTAENAIPVTKVATPDVASGVGESFQKASPRLDDDINDVDEKNSYNSFAEDSSQNFSERVTKSVSDTIKNSKTNLDTDGYVDVRATMHQNILNRNYNNAKSVLQNELTSPTKKETKVVTVYAAKGGVGKTTLSCELAAYLSRVNVGRDYLRVCIVDYNVDFGDVLTTLRYDSKGANMSYWAAEIRERMARGENADEITYTKEQIESKLQKNPETGLYALVAPVTHQDSMLIDGPELEVMLNNITKYGDFDFVICDTGNNTRDSSFYAVRDADVILLVVTQDVSTVSCNSSFISAMKRYDKDEAYKFSFDKIKLVVNCMMPYKYTKVTTEDIVEMLNFECIAQIKRNPDVTTANNMGEPLVLSDQNHEFSKSIKKIVSYLMGKDITDDIDSDSNKGFFKRLFRRG